jgi:hypothetical protein
MLDMKQIPGWFQRTPVGKKMIADTQAAQLRDRQTILDEIAALEKRLVAEHPPLAKRVDETKERIHAAAKVLADAQAVHRDAVLALNEMSHGIETAIAQRRMQLRRSADHEAIAAFSAELEALWEKTKHITPSAQLGERTMLGRVHPVATNAYAIRRYHQAVRDAMGAIDGLYEWAEYDVSEKIAGLRASIPSLDEAQFMYEPVA